MYLMYSLWFFRFVRMPYMCDRYSSTVVGGCFIIHCFTTHQSDLVTIFTASTYLGLDVVNHVSFKTMHMESSAVAMIMFHLYVK